MHAKNKRVRLCVSSRQNPNKKKPPSQNDLCPFPVSDQKKPKKKPTRYLSLGITIRRRAHWLPPLLLWLVIPLLPRCWSTHGGHSVAVGVWWRYRLGNLAVASARLPAAAEQAAADGHEEEKTDNDNHRDEDWLVVVDPVENLLAKLCTLAVTVEALATTFAGGAVEEVLSHRKASVGPKLGGLARQGAAAARA